MRTRAILVLALAAAGCGPQRPPNDPDGRRPLDPGVAALWKKEFQEFAAALKLIASQDPVERTRGIDRASAMAPYEYFNWLSPTDQQLLTKARAGDEAAVAELTRRGDVLETVQTFHKPYDKRMWEAARQRICSKGADMAAYVAQVLLLSLLQSKNQQIYPEIRTLLVAVGEPARVLVIGVLIEKADRAEDVPVGRWGEITQLTAALVAFGDRGAEGVRAVAESPKRYVRVCAARAIAEARALEFLETLSRMLLGDRDWEVRAAAAEALGSLRAKERSWRPLLQALERERDKLVQPKVLVALGRSNCVEAVPRLVSALDVPKEEVVLAAAEALYDLTGERLTTRAEWVKWYREKYPEWKAKRPP